jgi:hypothetical protein
VLATAVTAIASVGTLALKEPGAGVCAISLGDQQDYHQFALTTRGDSVL